MKVERSTKHERFMQQIGQRYNVRYDELRATGLSPEDAAEQATEEIIRPELRKRTTKTTMIVGTTRGACEVTVTDWKR